MTIWILDCATTYCTKVHLSAEREKELENDYDGSVEDFLCDHEKELGIIMKSSSWMTASDDNFEEIDF